MVPLDRRIARRHAARVTQLWYGRPMRTALLALALVACQEDHAECPTCPACPDPATTESTGGGGLTLEPWEAELLGDQVQQLRAGVRPFDAQGWGVCTGSKKCGDFIGTDPGTLAPGEYLLRAELSVPRLGDGWTARFDQSCEVTRPNGQTSTRDSERSHDIAYAGDSRGYRLEPLIRIQSPAPDGDRACTATLTPIRPDGTAGEPWKASWRVPGPAK
jgi:hypothetical protein